MATKKYIYPSEAALKKMDKKLAKTHGSVNLPPNASPVDALKHELCAEFVRYLMQHKLSQRELARAIGLAEPRVSEILHYRHGRFTIDHLMKYLAKIKPRLRVRVA